MEQKFILDLVAAKRVAAAAGLEATKNNWEVAIAIVDDSGHLMYLQRDKVQLGSIDVAIEKAKTALLYRRPTKYWEDVIANGRQGYLTMPSIFAVEGGIPLIYQDVTIGAIGVSGVKSTDDGIIAQAGASAL
jgi:uncharacterized protein GlcG (DUF336 family)